MTRRLGIILAGAIVLMVAGITLSMVVPEPARQLASSVTGAIGGPFSLIAADGRAVTDQTYRGKWVLIYFGYTNCPDACPTALNDMGVALDRLGPDATAIQPVFITVDPKRDTREKLTEYLKSFDPRIVALTGTEDQIAPVVKEFRVYVAAHEENGGDKLVDHSSFFYVLNPEGKFVKVIAGDLSGDGIAERLKQFINHSA